MGFFLTGRLGCGIGRDEETNLRVAGPGRGRGRQKASRHLKKYFGMDILERTAFAEQKKVRVSSNSI